jgi:hypothetical protein
MSEQIVDFRKLSPPPAEAIAKRNEQVELLKQQLGHKYLLSKPMPRIQ